MQVLIYTSVLALFLWLGSNIQRKCNLGKKEFILLIIPGYSASLGKWHHQGRNMKPVTPHPVKTKGEMSEYVLTCSLACLCSAPSLHSYTVQESLPREWYPLGGLSLPGSVNLVKTISIDTSIV